MSNQTDQTDQTDAPAVQTSDPEVTTLANFYPFPFRVNFDSENADGEYDVRQIELMPGEVVELEPEEWKQVKEMSVVQAGLNNQRLMQDIAPARLKRERKGMSNNMIDASLIGELSQEARNSDLDEVASEQVAEAERILRKAKKEARGSTTQYLR